MAQPVNRILKSDNIEIEGRLNLDLEAAGQSPQNSRHVTAGITKVRILENQNEYAVMEVTCSCGRKTIIRCDYSKITQGTDTSNNTAKQS